MKIAFAGSYIPRKCGIATFTHSLYCAAGNDESIVVALDDGVTAPYPGEVKCVIRDHVFEDYIAAADYINASGAEVCCLQHEYGIFGGELGSYITAFASRLKIPMVTTFHTVLNKPSEVQRSIVSELIRLSDKVVVMSETARSFLLKYYGATPSKIEVIPHGVPTFQRISKKEAREKTALSGRRILLTFGLLGRNKGIETVIQAMTRLIKKYPDLVYLVVGKTHPHVVAHEGERYRTSLKEMVQSSGLENHVIFVDEFVHEKELFTYLQAADFYITPYHNEEQITSGTLSYAMGAGAVVLSTPYWHAEEILSQDRGVLFPVKDSARLATTIESLLNDPVRTERLTRNATAYGETITWEASGNNYRRLFAGLKNQPLKKNGHPQKFRFPQPVLTHLQCLTDRTGIVQHAKYGVPDFKEGYCLDDNARALMLCGLMLRRKKAAVPSPLNELSRVYLSFIHYMHLPDGRFRNFLPFTRAYEEELGSEDSFGRTLWALGTFCRAGGDMSQVAFANDLFRKSLPATRLLHHPRAIANTLLGLIEFELAGCGDNSTREMIKSFTARLFEQYRSTAGTNWKWFEPSLTYDNALLPLAMLRGADHIGDKKIAGSAIEAARFLEQVVFRTGCYSPVGNEGWYPRHGQCALYAQQPVDAMMQVLLYQYMFERSNDPYYYNQMLLTISWFTGNNILQTPLCDESRGSCFDGLEADGVNRNQGAESTLAYLIALASAGSVKGINFMQGHEHYQQV